MLTFFCLFFPVCFLLPNVEGSAKTALTETSVNTAGALLNGSTITNMRSGAPQRSTTPGGCEWYGSGMFCNGMCPSSFQDIAKETTPREGTTDEFYFGTNCAAPLTKAYCCRSSYNDCGWGGRWQSSRSGKFYYSKFDSHYNFDIRAAEYHIGEDGPELIVDTERCGFVTFNDWRMSMENTYHKIYNTDKSLCSGFVFEENITAEAMCGTIHFYENGKKFDTWYKVV